MSKGADGRRPSCLKCEPPPAQHLNTKVAAPTKAGYSERLIVSHAAALGPGVSRRRAFDWPPLEDGGGVLNADATGDGGRCGLVLRPCVQLRAHGLASCT